MTAAASACAEAEAARPRASIRMGGAAFDDWRDADDLLCGSLEVLTTTGKYFWIPFEAVTALQPHPVRRPRDLFLRRASLSVADGPHGDVYLPVLYPAPDTVSDQCRLGRATEWVDGHPGAVRGVGQKMFLLGQEGVPMLQLGAVEAGE